AALFSLAACSQGSVDSASSAKAFPKKLLAVGTEPFWSIAIDGADIAYTFPADEPPVKARFARSESGGVLTLTGTLKGQPVTITIAPGKCSDDMSDRVYPYSAKSRWGDSMLDGCARR